MDFSTNFRILPIGVYDSILGLDWLSSHSPMQVDWAQKWLAFQYAGKSVTLQGVLPVEQAYNVVSVAASVSIDT